MTTNEAKSGYELTDDYCRLIAAEVESLESILSGDASFQACVACETCGESPSECEGNESDEPHDYEAHDAQTLELFTSMAENSGEENADYQANVIDWLNGLCLDFKITGELSEGEWEVTGAKVLRTFGGPNCWIEFDESSSVLIDTYWGGDHVARRVFAPNLSSAIDELTEL